MAKEEVKEEKEEKVVNTTKSVKEKPKSVEDLDKQMKNAAKILGKQETKQVFIPAYLEKRLGKTVPVGVAGAVIHVPVGEKVKIPKAMAAVLDNMLENMTL